MVIPEQTKNRSENDALGSSYTNLATGFDKIPQSFISATTVVMKLYRRCEKLMSKNDLWNHMKS